MEERNCEGLEGDGEVVMVVGSFGDVGESCGVLAFSASKLAGKLVAPEDDSDQLKYFFQVQLPPGL